MRLNATDIRAIIPHAGAMCLLDGVVDWNADSIRCISGTHVDPANPLRVDGRLPALCGIEYAAQAMAVHGSLSGAVDGKPRAGYLIGVRDVCCFEDRLDDLAGEMMVEAERLVGDADRVIYSFALRIGKAEVLTGRAVVILDAAVPTEVSVNE